jgi:YbgC/YbaW family acyl-CoA thioester hydrolase
MALTFPFSVDITVRGYEIDNWGHVNNAVYLQWLEHARWEMGGPEGFGALYGDGTLPVVRHVELDYRSETLLGDTLRISLWPRRVGHSSFVLGGAIRVMDARDKARIGKLAMVASTAFACIKRGEGKISVPDVWRKYFPPVDPGDVLPPGI